jgi:hypothetical protein
MAERKYRKAYFDEWWNIRKSSIYLLIGVPLALAILGGGFWYAYKHDFFVPKQDINVPKDSARIVSFEGEVRITRASTRETIIVKGETFVAAGDIIQTMSDGRAVIQMIDGSRVQVKPDSTMVIKSSTSLFGSKDVRLSVDDGQVNVRTNEAQDVNNVVELAESENKLQSNTDASFNAEGGTSSGEIRVSRGGVETTIGGEKTTLTENEFAALNGGKITARERLIGAPRPVSPGNASQIVDPGGGVSVTFAWQDAEGNPATSYRLQVSRSPIFASDAMMVDRDALNTREFRLVGLSPGNYYWRVKGTARSGQTTEWNDAAKFVVVRGNAAPVIDASDWHVEGVGGNVYIITGRTGPGMVRSQGRETFAGSDGTFRIQISATAVENAVEIGDDRGNRTGFVISLRSGQVVRRY